jgi:ABC-type dipeptide transport system, periplasmic component
VATWSIRGLAACAAISLALLAGCGSAGGDQPQEGGEPAVGGTLRVGVAEDLDAIDPSKARGEVASTWGALVYETLVGITRDGEPAPGLAKTWTVSEDGLTYTFELDDATFHDGTPVTSEAVAWNFSRIGAPDSGASQQAFMADIASMETPDPKTLIVHLKKPNGAFLSILSLQGRMGIQSPKNFDGDDMVAHIGSGPYTWESFTPNDRLVLKRYPDYWRGTPAYIETIEVRILPDDNARLQAMARGELDMAWGIDAVQVNDYANRGAFTVQEDRQNRGNFFSINVNKEPFDDVRLRRAMHMAVSRNDIAAAGWGGYAEPTNQPFAKTSPWYVAGDFPVDADIEGAKRLVQQAGAEGTEVRILVWDALGSEHEAQIVASAWTEIGLKPTIEKVDITTLVSKSIEGDFDVIYLWIGLITDPSRPYAYFHEGNVNNGLVGGLQLPALTKAVDDALATSDFEERKELYAQILKTNYEQAAQYYTVNPKIFVAVGPRVKGYEQGSYNVVYHGGGLPVAYLETK